FLAGTVIDPDWFAKFGGFQMLRNMQLQGIFDRNVSSTIQGRDPGYCFWSPLVATEWLVKACNEMGCPLYLCLLALGTNDTHIDTAQRVLSGRTDLQGRSWPGLTGDIWLEFFNEIFDPPGTLITTTFRDRAVLMFPGFSGNDDVNRRAYFLT